MVDRIRPKRRIMRKLRIDELSSVDRPAQSHARMTLMKRADDSDLPDRIAKSYASPAAYVDPANGARSFSTVLQEEMQREKYYEVMQEAGSAINALDSSLRSIAGDAGMDSVGKQAMMRNSIEEFLAAMRVRWPEVEEALDKGYEKIEEGDEAMTAAEKQQLDELQKTVAKLTKDLEAATATDQGAKVVALAGELETANAQVTELTEKLAKTEAASAEALAKAAMSDAEKAHMAGMSDEEKKAFMMMSPEDRAKKMKKSVDEDPVVYKAADGTEFRKSAGDALVALAKRADESDKRAAEETKKREDGEFAKRADDELKPFAESVAKREDKIEVLRAIDKMEAGPKAAILKMLEVGGKAIGAAFEKIGSRSSDLDIAKTALAFEKHVSDIMARDKITKTAAMSKARVEHPEAFDAYRDADGAAVAN